MGHPYFISNWRWPFTFKWQSFTFKARSFTFNHRSFTQFRILLAKAQYFPKAKAALAAQISSFRYASDGTSLFKAMGGELSLSSGSHYLKHYLSPSFENLSINNSFSLSIVDWNGSGDSSGISKNWRPWTEQSEGSGWSLARGKRPQQWKSTSILLLIKNC